MRRFHLTLVVAGVLCFAGCASSPPPHSESVFEDDAPPAQDDLFLGNIRQAFADHVDDCLVGLSFTSRSISRGIANDWARLSKTLD